MAIEKGVYKKPHGSGDGSGGTIIMNINNNGGQGQDLNVKSITANVGDITKLKVHTANIDDANIMYLMSSEGQISKISGNDLHYDSGWIGNFISDEVKTKKLTVDETATINQLIANYINSNQITTDYLTVNKSAHFFELIIDKVRSVEGTQINTAANCVAEYVEAYDSNGLLVDLDDPNLDESTISYYDIYWRTRDDDGKSIENKWITNDQAFCESFNVATGTSYDTSNKYYWRLVTASSNDSGANPVYMNFLTHEWDTTPHANNTSVIEIPDLFTFTTNVNGTDVEFIDFEIDAQRKEWDEQQQAWISEWDSTTNTWNAETTTYGLQIRPIYTENNETYRAIIKNGTFTFETTELSKLNIGIYYDDDTYEFFAADNDNPSDGFKTQYSITTSNTEAGIKMIIINTVVIDEWDECHWIRLSNTVCDTGVSGKSAIPSVGDNIVQLGYRYGANPTDDDESRASAIIIAAYKTPDGGGYINGKAIPAIKPPSYAQYQYITDFNLYTHRGTWMDSSGCYIKGNLVSSSYDFINIDNDLTVDVDYYGLISNESPVTKPSSGSKTVRFTVLHVLNGVGSLMTNSNLTNWYIIVNNGGQAIYTTNGTNYFPYNITSSTSDTSLDIKLYDPDGNLKDDIIVSIIDLGSVTDGINGDFDEWIYKNNTITPSRPTSSGSAIPAGWSKTPTTPSEGEYTYMSTRHVTGTSGGYDYSAPWSIPVRITGDNGDNGVDGDTTEFIYRRFSQSMNWNNINTNLNPGIWNTNQNPDYTGEAYYSPYSDAPDNKWQDNPQGVNNTYKYEYVSQRYFKYQDVGDEDKEWGTFTSPVLWSKYGEQGMDGDGVEYIFARTTTNDSSNIIPITAYTCYINNPYIQTTSDGSYMITGVDYDGLSNYIHPNDAEYLPPSYIGWTGSTYVPITVWKDDPQGVNATYKFEWVSQRKYDGENKQWDNFSTPSIWANWSKDGSTGIQGPQGDDGENGVVDKLVPYITLFEVRTTSTDDYSDIVSKLYANLQYQVWHADGDVVSQVTGTALNSYSIRGTVRAANRDILVYNLVTSTGQDGFAINNNMFKLYDGSNYYMTNMLDHLGYSPSAVYHDYRKLSQSSTLAGNYLPIEIRVELLLNGNVVDSKVHEVIFKAGHVFEVTDAALNSAFFGSWTKNGVTVNGMSQIHQDMGEISTNVSTLSNELTGLQSDYSTFKQSSTAFETRVNSYYFSYNGGNYSPTITQSSIEQTASSISTQVYHQNPDGYQTSSQVQQTAESISLGVQSDIEGKLINTGINIENQQITLTADNTIINGNLSIKNSNDGITIYDENGADARVQIVNAATPTGISNVSAAINSTVYQSLNRSNSAGTEYFTLKKIPLGTFDGNILSLTRFNFDGGAGHGSTTEWWDMYSHSDRTTISITLRLTTNSSDSDYTSGTQIFSGAITGNVNDAFRYYKDLSYTSSALTGTYYLGGRLTINWRSAAPDPNQLDRRFQYNVIGSKTSPNGEWMTMMGNDGAIFKSTDQRYVMLNKDAQIFKYDNAILKNCSDGLLINERGFEQTSSQTGKVWTYSTIKFGPVDSVVPYGYYNGSNSHDGLVTIDGTQRRFIDLPVNVTQISLNCGGDATGSNPEWAIFFPANAPIGKEYFITNDWYTSSNTEKRYYSGTPTSVYSTTPIYRQANKSTVHWILTKNSGWKVVSVFSWG